MCVFGGVIFICIPLPYMQAVNLEIKGFEWKCDCGRIVYVDEYDDGAFKRFMIEASYHLRFIFLSNLRVCVSYDVYQL